jgi:cation diffusion facilitator family transporter
MHTHNLDQWRHRHDFTVIHEHGERRTVQVLLLTALTMVLEIGAGLAFGSMALLADGWHMGTHVAAFAITVFAYRYAKRHANSERYSFGTGKVSVLGGFASAVALVVVALMMVLESVQRLANPHPIRFNEAIGVAVLGLIVNLVSALLLQSGHHHDGDHGRDRHHDHNLRAAYLHVVADAFTSVLAIVALSAGKYLGWNRLDPLMGIVGAAVITRWAYGLLKETSTILLDGSIEGRTRERITHAIESDRDNRISDLHVWKVGPAHYAAVISVVTHHPKSSEYYKMLVADVADLAHTTVEVIHCQSQPCLPVDDT